MDIKTNNYLISIVIPVYNGEKSIGRLVEELITELTPEFNIEIILVNDCSPDNSEKVCISLFEKYKNIVRVYTLAKNVGEHNAVMAGLNNVSGDYIVIMDDDFQNPVDQVVRLISYAMQNTYDVVYTYYDNKKHSFFRNLGSRFNDLIANYMLKKPKNLYLSSFKILNRFLVNEIIKYNLPFPYIDGLILRTTSNFGKVKVEHQERQFGKSNYSFLKLISLWSNMFTNFSILPLRISIIIGFIFSLFGFTLGIQAFIEKILNPNVPLGYTSLIVLISIFSGVQLIAIGMVGEYLGRIFLSQNKKPQYSIRRKFD